MTSGCNNRSGDGTPGPCSSATLSPHLRTDLRPKLALNERLPFARLLTPNYPGPIHT
jgi:hypothetical protein